MMKTLCIVHVFYPDFWPEIASCLRNVDGPLDLVVTYVDETKGIPEMVRGDFPEAKFVLCENRGFDIWPFLKALQSVDLSAYSVLVKLHTKRDVRRDGKPLVFNHCDFSESAWREYLLGFIHDKESWAATRARLAQPGVGMVADRHVILRRDDTPWFGTRHTMDRALALVEELYGFPARNGAQFVAGTMFAARPLVFKRLLGRGWAADDFVQSVHDNTEQTAHVLERAPGIVVTAEGLRIDSPLGDLGRWRVGTAVRDFLLAIPRFLWSDERAVGRRIVKICGISVYRSGRRSEIPEKEDCVVVPAPYDGRDYAEVLRTYVLRETSRHSGHVVRVIGERPCEVPLFCGNVIRNLRTRRFLRKHIKLAVGKPPKGSVRADMGPDPIRVANCDFCWLGLVSSRNDARKSLFCHFHRRTKESLAAARAFAKANGAVVRYFSDDAGAGGPVQYVDAVANATWVMTDTKVGESFAAAFGKPVEKISVSPRRVLLVSHELTVTGAPNSLLRQAKYFLEDGCKVDVWTYAGGDLAPRYQEAGLEPELVANDRRAIEAKWAANPVRYDLVICNTICTYKCVDVLRRRGMPVVWFIRETRLLDEEAWLNQDFDRVFRSFPNLYTVSEYNASVVRDYNRRVRIVRNSVPDSFTSFSRPADKLRFGFIGSLIPVKGIDLLVEAFRRVHAEFPATELKIAGKVSVGIGERLRAETEGDDSVVWLGEVQGDEKRAFFDAIDVLCVPSLDEPCGLTVLEAAMYGKAIVTTDRTGAKYVVDEDCGWVVRAGDLGALVAALRELAAMDPAALRGMSAHARSRYQECASPEVERAAVLRMLRDHAGKVPHVWRPMLYEGEEPFIREKRYDDGRRYFYIRNFRVYRIDSEGMKRR